MGNEPTAFDRYSVCDNGQYQARACPAGLHWNGRFACTWPEDSGCHADGSMPGDEEANNVISEGERDQGGKKRRKKVSICFLP